MSDDNPRSLLGQVDTDVNPAAAAAYDLHHHNSNQDHTRASVQTTLTGAPTETTFGPSVDSPTASALLSQGLAPRPPSYQRSRPYDPAAVTNSAPDHHNQFGGSVVEHVGGGEQFSPSPPLAPEDHRAPAKRHPQGNGRSSTPGNMEAPQPSQHYSARPPGVYGDSGLTVPVPERRRKKSTMPKSPLQKLELTLDSMTKEEKRARIEAAERRARERLAREAGHANVNQPQPEEPSRRPSQSQAQKEPASYSDSRPTQAVVPPSAQQISRETYQYPKSRSQQHDSRDSGSQQPQPPQHYQQYDDEGNYGAPAPFSARDIPHVAPAREPEAHELPKRNLSFRERAARDDIKLPTADEGANVSAQEQSAPKKGFSFSLTRSGSNKLKKAPPGDSWHNARREGGHWAPLPAPHSNSVPASDEQQPLQQHDASTHRMQHQVEYQDPSRTAVTARRPSAAAAVVADRAFVPNPPPEVIKPVQRRATEPVQHGQHAEKSYFTPIPQTRDAEHDLREGEPPTPAVAAEQRRLERQANGGDVWDNSNQYPVPNLLHNRPEHIHPGGRLYSPPLWLDEWKKAIPGKLSGPLIDLSEERRSSSDTNKAWWEEPGRQRSSSYTSRTRKSDTYEDEYGYLSGKDLHDNYVMESQLTSTRTGPTSFKPQLYLECGPLLRYCGIRPEKVPARTRGAPATVREMWRGTVMIVTRDSESSYDVAPCLRLFLQDLELLPTPPHQVNGELSPEYVDPIGGHPKTGRRGETLYVRPVDCLRDGKDVSDIETDDGLFEATRSGPDVLPPDGSADWPGTFTSRMKRTKVDGEKMQKFKDVKGFRLHAERGCTFWRFNIEVELSGKQQRVAYSVNKGPSMSFWVPAKETAMNVMFHSCNGFNLGTKTDLLSGPDPMWRDVLNTHQTSPFHVMVGGGNQIYNDAVAEECDLLIDWLELRDPLDKHSAPFAPELQAQLEGFYFRRYCSWFSSGLFGLASSQIPMVNIWSDRESFNGFGSFPHKDMNSPVLSGLGAVSFKYYMLFQHQSIIPETEVTEPSWVLGAQPGPYVNELSRNVYVSLGSKMALLAVDCRTERTEDDVIHSETWQRIMNRLYAEVRRGHVEHLLVVLPVPVAYPRLVWLENV